jgi:hypothetical protein
MNMKKNTLVLPLLSLALLLPQATQPKDCPNKIIQSKVIALIDGTSLLNIYKIISYGHSVQELLNGHKDPVNGCQRKGFLVIGTQLVTLKEAAKMEREYSANHPHIQEALQQAKSYLKEKTIIYIEQIKPGKNQILQLIKDWDANSPLFTWVNHVINGKDRDQDLFKEHNSLEALSELCTMLLTFLSDLIQSCPKSRARYNNEIFKKNSPIAGIGIE